MKRVIILTAFLGFCAAVFAAPVREREKRITIELEGNPTTGYSWTYTMEPEGIVREFSAEYRRPSGAETADAGGRAGRGGVFVFVFESIKPGLADLRFSYARPWESGVEPAERADYRLTVNRAGEIRARRH